MITDQEIQEQIEGIEKQLRTLRLAIEQRKQKEESLERQQDLVVGDWVEILNPNFGQERTGVVVKYNPETNYVTVLTGKRIKRKVVRIATNLRKIERKER